MVSQVKNITAGKLQLRLKTTKEKDELNELAKVSTECWKGWKTRLMRKIFRF